MDDWRPHATLTTLRARARCLAVIRSFFGERGLLEVETPQLSIAAATDPALASLATRWPGPDGTARWLHTSPEFPMKRLLAAGSGDIWQLARVFRDGERGRRHHPEFTLLEWYRLGWDHHRLMDEVTDLVTKLLDGHTLAAVEKLTYREAFIAHAGLDPFIVEPGAWHAAVKRHDIDCTDLDDTDIDGWRDLLLTHVVEPHLGQGRLTLIHDYPASQAALARVRTGDPSLAERFELYWQGVELANGYHELTDAAEQRRRVEDDLVQRRELGLPEVLPDARFLAALDAGLPDCAGVALGVDRLLMLALGLPSLDDVLAFPIERA
ncbi:MAG: EF-P lysine aminoacylase GenX [Gammaproteobacteria bacterium]|nr:MAG: EF-P lysine aminoacylase GenX [Gammaproteobacteria bacterium]